MVTWFANHCDRDLCQITLFGFTVIWIGSKNTEVLLTKICTLNFILLIVIVVAFAIIYTDKCFSCLQLISLFIITSNLLTFSVYAFLSCLFFPPIWESLERMALFDWKEIKSTSTLKSDNDSPSFQHCGQFSSMQSFELESHVCVQIVSNGQ